MIRPFEVQLNDCSILLNDRSVSVNDRSISPSGRSISRRGFTLIELMVAMTIGFLVLAGAFEMHSAFSRQSIRQQEAADMQQALRVASQVIGRSVRTAGVGLNGGVLDLFDTAAAPNAWTLGAVQFSNTNLFPNGYPVSAYDKIPGDTEPNGDPDWLRVVSFDGTAMVPDPINQVPTLVEIKSITYAANGTSPASLLVSDVRPFPVGAFFFAYNADYTNNSNALPPHKLCARRVTTATSPILPPTDYGGTITFDTTSQYNPPPGPAAAQDPCMNTLGVNFKTSGTSYVFALDRSVIFRIDKTNAKTPRLKAWYSPPPGPGSIPNFYPEATPNWQTLTENIEDLQIAEVLTNGIVCGTLGYSTDDASATGPCQPQSVRAVRFTLVARSSSPIPGWTLGGIAAIEDEAATPNDGYLRRVLTEEVQVRNIPWVTP